MDVALPLRAVLPTLDGRFLSVLARTTRPLTGREVQQLAGAGSPNGIRLALARLVKQGVVYADDPAWLEQVDHLRDQVEAWTGNHCQVFQLDVDRLAEHVAAGDPLVDDWLRDSIPLGGTGLRELLRDRNGVDE